MICDLTMGLWPIMHLACLGVGLLALIVSMADLLSLHVGVGSCLGIPSSASADQIHLTFFAAVTAAMSSASVELRANVFLHHLACASSVVMQVLILDPGE